MDRILQTLLLLSAGPFDVVKKGEKPHGRYIHPLYRSTEDADRERENEMGRFLNEALKINEELKRINQSLILEARHSIEWKIGFKEGYFAACLQAGEVFEQEDEDASET